MTTGTTGFTGWLLKWTALLGLAAGLVVGADRLVGSLRRDVQVVLARPAPARSAPAEAPAPPVRVARAGRP